MEYVTEEIGRVMGSQIYIYNSPEEIPVDPPRGVNDVFIDINLGKVYQWDGTEWKYKFPIPNDSRIVDIVDELTALGARLEDEESARVVAENARVSAEQSRVAAETEREGNEDIRKSAERSREAAEQGRVVAEGTRNDNESLREEAEDARQTAEGQRAVAEGARATAEASRASAETARATAESGRASAEQARVGAESARATAEGQRAAAETARANAESARASAETSRQTNESTRQSNESTRQSQESARQTAEGARAGAEQTRAQNEVARQVAESNREDAEGLRVQAENTRAANDTLWNQHEQTRQANEAQRVLAEQARVEAEAGRQYELDSKITFGSSWFDGTGGVGYSETSDNWTPYSDESGAFQSKPMISQGTGTDNNTAIITTGNYAQLREKQGNTMAVNNQLKISSSESGIALTKTENADGSITFTNNTGSTINSPRLFNLNGGSVISGHKYVFLFKTSIGTNNYLRVWDSTSPVNIHQNEIVTANRDLTNLIELYLIGSVENGASFTLYKIFSDITQFFGGNDKIPQDLLDNPDHFFWYYNGSLAYDAGSLENANGVKLVCTKRNLFNPATAVANTALGDDGTTFTSNGITTSDYIPIVPNRQFHLRNAISSGQRNTCCMFDKDKNFIVKFNIYGEGTGAVSGTRTAPSNARYVRVSMPNAYVNDCDISLYYTTEEGGEGYDKHYDYEEPTVVNTGSEELLAFDTKDPDGTIERRTKEEPDLSQVSFGSMPYGGHTIYYYNFADKKPQNIQKGIVSSKYAVINDSLADMPDKSIRGDTDNGTIYIRDDSGAPSGSLQYELKDSAKTTEQGTPFPENIDIDDYGMMYWLDENDELVGIPQGAKFFYPVNYKGFTDDLYNRTEGDAGNVVIQSELEESETERDAVDAKLKEALGGMLRHQLADKLNIDFLDTDVLDIGEIPFFRTPSGLFQANITTLQIKAPESNDDVAHMLCSIYKTIETNSTYGPLSPTPSPSMVCCLNTSHYLYFNNTSYTDTDAFKAAMKGVLLAYEKA